MKRFLYIINVLKIVFCIMFALAAGYASYHHLTIADSQKRVPVELFTLKEERQQETPSEDTTALVYTGAEYYR